MDGNRTIEYGNPNVFKLNTEHVTTIASQTCNVNYVFLDDTQGNPVITCYTNERDNPDIFDRNKMLSSQNEQNAIVSCDQTDETNSFELLSTSIDFGFILKEPRGFNTVKTLECGKGYCLVRIVTQGCLNSKYILRSNPSTQQNTIKWLNLIMSMLGSASSMFRIQGPFQQEEVVIGNGVFMGLNTSTVVYAFKGTCRNQQNLPCDANESNKYGLEVLTGIKLVSNSPEDLISFKDVQKRDGTDDEYILNFFFKKTDLGNGLMIQQYINHNRLCARGLEPTGLFNTFIDIEGFYKISCVVCGINSYYSESKISAPFIVTSQTLYISSKADQDNGVFSLSYFIAASRSPSDGFKKKFRQESTIDLGTDLLLKYGDISGTIIRVEYEGRDISFSTNNENGEYSIRFKITQEMSGKLIRVHINDPSISIGQLINPVLIYARPATIQQVCMTCPIGKFSGIPMAMDNSACIDTMLTKPMRASQSSRSLLSTMNSNRRSLDTNPKKFNLCLEINGKFIIIKQINRIAKPSLALSDFALEVWLETNNEILVKNYTEFIEGKLFKIYESSRSDLYSTGATQLKLVSSNGPLIFTLEGMYANKTFPAIAKLEDSGWFQWWYGAIGGAVVFSSVAMMIVIHAHLTSSTKYDSLKPDTYYPA